ncbi:hypothetical protein OC846_001280 [Tilletia horrida]|uniref:Endosomal/vacuolar adapter protein YPT35 n=1 Tax=Tilletia horrida TaxID=155126 RepID=A0AAN6GU49_9BASI|nr:hypothetical protein OC846_001280 [Tilletia horrida]
MMTSPRRSAMLADAISSQHPSSYAVASPSATPPPKHHRPLPDHDDDDKEPEQQLIVPLYSPSDIPHPMAASTTWHTPVRDPHPTHKIIRSSPTRPRLLHSPLSSPPPTLASSRHYRRGSIPSSHPTSPLLLPDTTTTSGAAAAHLDTTNPLSSSPSTPAFFLECFGKDVTPGKRAAPIPPKPRPSITPSSLLTAANTTTELSHLSIISREPIILSPVQEASPSNWPSASAAGNSSSSSSALLDGFTSFTSARQDPHRSSSSSSSPSDPTPSSNNITKDEPSVLSHKSPYDSPPSRLEGLFDGLPTQSSSHRLPDNFRFTSSPSTSLNLSANNTTADTSTASASRPPPLINPAFGNWFSQRSDADAVISTDGRARSEADAVPHHHILRANGNDDADDDDEYGNGDDDDDDDDDDRASIASSLLSLPVSIVTTASGGNNSRFLEEQQAQHQQQQQQQLQQQQRERQHRERTGSFSVFKDRSLRKGLSGLGIKDGAAAAAGGSAKESFLTALASSSKKLRDSHALAPPHPSNLSSTASPSRTGTNTSSIQFAADLVDPQGTGKQAGNHKSGTRSRTASLLSSALPLGGGGGGASSSSGPDGDRSAGPASTMASWKRRGLAALTSPTLGTGGSSGGGSGHGASLSVSHIPTGKGASPLPSPGLNFSSLSSSVVGTPHSGSARAADEAGSSSFFPPDASGHHSKTTPPLPNTGSGAGGGGASVPPHRPASILLKPGSGGAPLSSPAAGGGGLPGASLSILPGTVSRPQSTRTTTSTQSGGSSSIASGSGSAASGSGHSTAIVGGGGKRRASEGTMARMLLSSSSPLRHLAEVATGNLSSSSSATLPARGGGAGILVPPLPPGGAGAGGSSGGSGASQSAFAGSGPTMMTTIFAREVRIGGWTYIGQKASGWVEYDIRVLTLRGTMIRASRRFSSFVALRKQLAKEVPLHRAALPELPPRRHGLLHRYSPTHLEQRRLALQRWLHRVLRDPRWGGRECCRDFILGGIGGSVGLGMGLSLVGGAATAAVPSALAGAPGVGASGSGGSGNGGGSGTASAISSARASVELSPTATSLGP